MTVCFDKAWFKAAIIRSIRTMAQTAIAVIGSSAVLSEINWLTVASSIAVAGILSILTALAGLPECEHEKVIDKPDNNVYYSTEGGENDGT